MRTRNQIEKLIHSKKKQISVLNDQIDLLKIESIQLCDSDQQYEEKEEVWTVKKRPLTKETHVVGRIHWVEDFVDEDTGQVVSINRSRKVCQDGVWLL